MQRLSLPPTGQAHGGVLNRLWRSIQAGVESASDVEYALPDLAAAHGDAASWRHATSTPTPHTPGGSSPSPQPVHFHHSLFPPAQVRGFAASAMGNRPFPAGFDAQAESEISDGCPASLEEYNDVLVQLARRKKIDELRDVFDDLSLDGIAPDRSSYHAVIGACMRVKSLQDVLFFYDRMMMQGLIPDSTLFHIILKACARARQPEKAFEVAGEMEAVGTVATIKTFQQLLNVCGKAGQVRRANDVVAQMKSKGIVLNKFCYAALIEAIANQKPHPGRETTGAEVLRMFDEARQNRDAWVDPYEGIPSLPGRRRHSRADYLSLEDDEDESSQQRPELIVYKAAVNGSVTLSFAPGVRIVMGALKEDGEEPDGELMHAALSALVRWRDFDQACQLLDDFETAQLGVSSEDAKELFQDVIFAKHMPTLHRLLARQLDPTTRTFFSARDGNGLLSMMDKMLRKVDYKACVTMWEVLQGMDIKLWLGPAKDHLRCLVLNKVPETDPHFIEVKSWVELVRSRALSGQKFQSTRRVKPEEAGQFEEQTSLGEPADRVNFVQM